MFSVKITKANRASAFYPGEATQKDERVTEIGLLPQVLTTWQVLVSAKSR